jgi:exodeoxyribonuclease VII small subunit
MTAAPKTPKGTGGSSGSGASSDATGELSYEAARAELREVLSRLEAGGQSLEESLALWERGEQLADLCKQWLDGASAQLDAKIAEHDAPAD